VLTLKKSATLILSATFQRWSDCKSYKDDMMLSPRFERGFAQSHPWWPHGGCCASDNHYATELWKVSTEFRPNRFSQKLPMINEPSQVIGKSFTSGQEHTQVKSIHLVSRFRGAFVWFNEKKYEVRSATVWNPMIVHNNNNSNKRNRCY